MSRNPLLTARKEDGITYTAEQAENHVILAWGVNHGHIEDNFTIPTALFHQLAIEVLELAGYTVLAQEELDVEVFADDAEVE